MKETQNSGYVVYSFSVPLRHSPGIREGLLVELPYENRWAEISPLPGRSQETLSQARTQLLAYLEGQPTEALYPSVQFGIESLAAPLALHLKVPLYPLLCGPLDHMLAQAQIAYEKGYRLVKCKISHLNQEEIHTLITSLQSTFLLRLDCNQHYSLKELTHILSSLERLDALEDPTYEEELLAQCPYPFLIDKIPLPYWTKELYPTFQGFVIKPTIWGGKQTIAPLLAHVKAHKLRLILSPCLETCIGLSHIVRLSHDLAWTEEPVGLDTHQFLSFDPFPHHLTPIAHGTTALPSV